MFFLQPLSLRAKLPPLLRHILRCTPRNRVLLGRAPARAPPHNPLLLRAAAHSRTPLQFFPWFMSRSPIQRGGFCFESRFFAVRLNSSIIATHSPVNASPA